MGRASMATGESGLHTFFSTAFREKLLHPLQVAFSLTYNYEGFLSPLSRSVLSCYRPNTLSKYVAQISISLLWFFMFSVWGEISS